VEFDVMLAATGEAVVIHDDQLERTTNGRGRVIDCSYNELRRLDAGSWFSPDFSNARVPLLQEVLQLLRQLQLGANIEIKPLEGYERQTVECVCEVLRENPLPSMLLSSFSVTALEFVKTIFPQAPLAALFHEWPQDWQNRCERLGCIAVDMNHTVLDPARVAEIKAQDYTLLAYTVNDPVRAQVLFSWGVDAVFSDCPQEMLDNLKEKMYGTP
jgi:glycerophosphoryl diester phosphodiesterase